MAMYNQINPYFNAGAEFTDETREQFLNNLLSGEFGGVELNRNGYRLFGNASTGYSKKQWNHIKSKILKWCQKLDNLHGPNNWILFTDGDGDYGHESIESIACIIANRGVPVVFLQSDFGYAEPATPYWPKYATAGYFGPGIRHLRQKKDKNGELSFDKNNKPLMTECWGGPQEDENGNFTGVLSFVDQAYFDLFNGALLENINGHLVVGGGEIVIRQMCLYKFGTREEDYYIIAFTKDEISSPANKVFINQIRRSAERIAWNTWVSKVRKTTK